MDPVAALPAANDLVFHVEHLCVVFHVEHFVWKERNQFSLAIFGFNTI